MVKQALETCWYCKREHTALKQSFELSTLNATFSPFHITAQKAPFSSLYKINSVKSHQHLCFYCFITTLPWIYTCLLISMHVGSRLLTSVNLETKYKITKLRQKHSIMLAYIVVRELTEVQ